MTVFVCISRTFRNEQYINYYNQSCIIIYVVDKKGEGVNIS